MSEARPKSRIWRKNTGLIREAALDVFSREGFAGATLDQIAAKAGMSKPNLLYYYRSKDEIHLELVSMLLADWLAPLYTLGEGPKAPRDQIIDYALAKLAMSEERPRESRLFANEIMKGAPHLGPVLGDELKKLMDDKSALLTRWAEEGAIAPADPRHLIFAIWAITQHYADFETQVNALIGDDRAANFSSAARFVQEAVGRMISP